MKCNCNGTIIKFNRYRMPKNESHFAQCDKCFRIFTWKEYRTLQADKIVEMVKKEEGKKSLADEISAEYRTSHLGKFPGKNLGD